jgi:3-methyladenine DNA glycosylase Tag
MQRFATIRARAAKRKGGDAKLIALLPKVKSAAALGRITDDRLLSDMTKRIFSAGFAWSVIEKKWPDFEAAFLGFEPKRLLAQPDEFWERLASDSRIVRNAQKIMAVRANARFISDIADKHGNFAKFLAAWPATDQVGLLDVLAKQGARLGGHTGQFFLRFIGKDCFVLSKDVVACLHESGLDIAENPSSKKDLRKIQEQFNAWAKETGLPLTHLSRICAMSIGENYDAATFSSRSNNMVEGDIS